MIEDFGEEHVRTGKPIAYTSADSVLQIAAHEEHFGLERPLRRRLPCGARVDIPVNIGRIMRVPFVGETATTFTRTGHRKDFAVTPPAPTLLEVLSQAGPRCRLGRQDRRHLCSCRHGTEIKVSGNPAFMETTLANMDGLGDGGFLMTNFVDFDTDFGHPPRSGRI